MAIPRLAALFAAALLLGACEGAPPPASPRATSSTSAPAGPVVVATAGSGSALAANPTASATRAAPASTAGATAAATATAATCRPGQPLTPAQTEGPFFKAGSPERATLVEAGIAGTRIALGGVVRTADCTPVARAIVDVWQTDAAGASDNAGYRLRGHVRTDESGRYSFQTIVPGEYTGRTVHFHVKVGAPGGLILTTQLYLAGVAANARDSGYQPQLALQDVQRGAEGMTARYDFVIARP